MRIETIETVKNIIEKQRMDQSSPKFQSGEIFSLEVAEQTGDHVLLRRADGWAFLARVMRDMGMQQGDRVEVIVKDVVDGKQVMQVLDIEKGEGQSKTPEQAQPAAAGDKMLAASAQDTGVKSHMLASTMAMLKQNASLSPKMAVFLAQNSIANTPENAAVLSQMVKGEQTVQTLLTDLVALQPQTDTATEAVVPLVSTEAAMQAGGSVEMTQPVIVQMQTDTVNAAQAAQPQSATSEQVQAEQPQSANDVQVQVEQPQSATSEQVQAERPQSANDMQMQVEQPQSANDRATQTLPSQQTQIDVTQQQGVQKQVALPETVQPIDQAAPGKAAIPPAAPANMEATELVTANESQAQAMQQESMPVFTDKQIASQISALFARLGKGERMGEEIKKDVSTLPAKLKALMTMIAKSDTKDKDVIAQKAGQMDKQFSLMAEAKRFVCMQFPFVLPDETPRNAELFVYRDSAKTKELDAENIVILLGLDTENIGRVETLVKVAGKGVSLKFHMEDTDAFGDIRAGEKQLTASLGDAGFRLTDMAVTTLNKRTTLINAESVLAGEAPPSDFELDVRI